METKPANPLGLVARTDTLTVNGRNYTTAFTAATRKSTMTTPQGRQSTVTIDTQGRVTQEQDANLEPVAYTYDAHGRLITASLGTGADQRTATFAYNTDGYLATITDPLGRVTSFAYDDAGRVTSETLPDNSMVLFSRDGNGNLTSFAPPERPAHSFEYNAVDLLSEYTPPDPGIGSTTTRYLYNLDQQKTRVLRPDGVAIDVGYDGAGRLSTITHPDGEIGYTYHASTGNLVGITAPRSALRFAPQVLPDRYLMARNGAKVSAVESVNRLFDHFPIEVSGADRFSCCFRGGLEFVTEAVPRKFANEHHGRFSVNDGHLVRHTCLLNKKPRVDSAHISLLFPLKVKRVNGTHADEENHQSDRREEYDRTPRPAGPFEVLALRESGRLGRSFGCSACNDGSNRHISH